MSNKQTMHKDTFHTPAGTDTNVNPNKCSKNKNSNKNRIKKNTINEKNYKHKYIIKINKQMAQKHIKNHYKNKWGEA